MQLQNKWSRKSLTSLDNERLGVLVHCHDDGPYQRLLQLARHDVHSEVRTLAFFRSRFLYFFCRVVEPRYQTIAGMFAGAALITGIFTGILSAFLWPEVIEHVGF